MFKNYFLNSYHIILFILFGLFANNSFAVVSQNYKVVNGVAIYYGIIPADIVQGYPKESPERSMNGGVPSGENYIHLIVALFDNTTGKRIGNAEVTATVGELTLHGETKKLDPIYMANTITYGNYFKMDGQNTYSIVINIHRPGVSEVTEAKFTYEYFPK